MLPVKDTCKVYHATNLFAAKVIQYNGIRLDVQRQLTDFGQGFYVTLNLNQAKNWAKIRAMHPQVSSELLDQLGISKDQYFSHPDTTIPTYLVYELNLKQLRELKGKIFSFPLEPDWSGHQRSWAYFVQECRTGKRHNYDYVYGPIGGGHLTDPYKVKVSKTKDQLSLNSLKAVKCLSNLKIVDYKPKEIFTKKPTIKQLFNHLRSLKNVSNDDNLFLLEIYNELMNIGDLTSQQANKMLQKSSITLKFDPTIMHEPPAYWAFSILYGTYKLWYKEYEMYMRKKN